MNIASTLVTSPLFENTSCTTLPPEGSKSALGRPGGGSSTPTLLAARSALPPEGSKSALGRPGGGFPSLVRTRIKICGITREQDLDAAVAAGTDAVGFVLYPKSPRYVSPERAAELARRLPPFVTPVLLFVNATLDDILTATRLIPGATLQFHGDESPADCDAAALAANCPYLRAARIPLGAGAAQFDLVKYAHNFSNARAILLDAHVDGYGGGGKVFNWSLLPPSVNAQLVLSGGLDSANVGDGIAQVRPRCISLAVDISSGVEAVDAQGLPLRGIKDPEKINQFVAAVRAADQHLAGII